MARKMITVLLTCFNRAEKTEHCIRSIVEGNPGLSFSFVLLDDASTDRTMQMLEQLQRDGIDIMILHGDGNSFWAGGMRKAIAYAKENTKSEFYLLVNDDVDFEKGAVEQLLAEYGEVSEGGKTQTALVGPTCNRAGEFTYGGIRYDRGIHYTAVTPEMNDRSCDTFNMNCLLLGGELFKANANFDPCYIHGLADFDYGLDMKRRNILLWVASFYVGKCEKNSEKGTWMDRSLPRRVRLKKKASPKGAPFRQWFHFLRKNFGAKTALLHGFTPYIRIIAGR
ncbi:MAG: glycosyltransferase [Agathobacter sp.]|nr:glycosyltransferase [Agathobacter sp.]